MLPRNLFQNSRRESNKGRWRVNGGNAVAAGRGAMQVHCGDNQRSGHDVEIMQAVLALSIRLSISGESQTSLHKGMQSRDKNRGRRPGNMENRAPKAG